MKFHCFKPGIGVVALALASLSLIAQPQKPDFEATPAESLKVLPDFTIELIYTIPKDQQGSWVSLCTDDQGRLIASDQYGSLYRIHPSTNPPLVEEIQLDIGHAQGLLYAFDSLYVVVNSSEHQGRGLYRVRDTDGDDQFDKVELLKKFAEEGGEHGPHAVILGPDQKSLYVVVGNQTALPEYDKTRVPPVWGEDLLLPRIYGNGFMRGVLAPRGWIAKTDPDGQSWEIIATGFRNEYDAAFNDAGDLFTFDADMEWDLNTPWYRPTRVCLVTSGAEFGWRNGSGKWPAYYPDSLPAVLDIGPGSPTGVAFGYGAAFPAKYQKAFFICDWSYGKLYAVHLKEDGASYTGEFEEFITGSPLPLTDIVVNPVDRAMYFTVGGRKTQSGLYKVTYTGSKSTSPYNPVRRRNIDRSVRKMLESFHGKKAPRAIEEAWDYLGHPDRFIRYAARVAVEHQDLALWQEKALAERRTQAALTAQLALARLADASVQKDLLKAMGLHQWSSLTQDQKLDLLRTYALAFIRMGEPDEHVRRVVATRLNQWFPAQSREVNAELCELLVYLQEPDTAYKGIQLLTQAPSQEEQIDYATSLRLLTTGWTPDLRETYFRWFLKAASYRGGASFRRFVHYIKEDAIERTPEQELESLQPIIDAQPEIKSPLQAMAEALAGRSFVKDWTLEELQPALADGLAGRDFENGRKMFGATGCFACHRFGNEGGSLGPDLTSAGGKFNPNDLLESIIDPNKEISDQYGQVQIQLQNGSRVTGRIVNLNENTIAVNTNMFDPNENANVNRKDVVSIGTADISMMPEGLLSVLTQEEILDLLAFVLSGGNREHVMFK